MKDFSGRTVKDYKAEIKKHQEKIDEYNLTLNTYYYKKIFDPSKYSYIGNVYTKKGTLRKSFVKHINLYREWIQNRKNFIAMDTRWMKNLEAKIKEAK